jgi:hypothetical protein
MCVTQIRAVLHEARVHHANVARTCRASSAQQGMLLLDPSVEVQHWKYIKNTNLLFDVGGHNNLGKFTEKVRAFRNPFYSSSQTQRTVNIH